MKRMGDPLTYDGQVSSTDISALKFARLHSPKMKSVYWRYFGFPTNDNDRIITKQNVVCLICHKVLTNHGNTTNLRAHLQHRHKELFSKMCSENGIKIPPRKTMSQHTKMKYEPPVQKIKLEYQDSNTQDSSNAASIGCDDQAMLYETMVPITYEDDEVINGEHFAKVEVGGSVIVGRNIAADPNANADAKSATSDLTEVVVTDVEQRVTSNFRIGLVEEMDTMQLQDALVNILIQDIRDVQSLFDPGMQNFVRMICGSMEIPSEKKLENLIKELHSDRLTSMSDQFKMHSLSKPYSLGFDAWSNVENKRFLSIYFNYTTDAPDYNLLNELYCTLEYNEFTPFDTIFAEFNLQYCAAALVNFEHDDYLKSFLRNKNIPIIMAFDLTVDKCLRAVFSLSNIAPIIDEIKEVITRYAQEINSKEVEIPLPNDDCPWTYFELLKFFSETVSWPEDMDILVNSAKVIINTLTTLSVSLDTLKGEEIPHSSMLSPITSKILNKKLVISDLDDDFVSAIKTTVAAELQKLVISDDHLTISALLDPRFHRLTTISNFSGCLQILKEKFSKICELKGFTQDDFNANKSSDEKPKLAATSRKSNLELFFDIEDASTTSTQHEESNVEFDLKRYRNEVHVSLDESPFCWWNKMGHLYGSLKQLAAQYQCIPCVINMNFKKPIKQQIYEHRKRYMLTGNLIDAILFLHYNSRLEN